MNSHKTKLLTVSLLALLSLTACGGGATGTEPNHAPITTANQEATVAYPLPIAGVTNDGEGDYLQSSIDEADPAWEFASQVIEDDVPAHLTEEQLTEAQHVFLTFAAEEGTDSVFRRPYALEDEALFNQWAEEHKHLFIPGAVVAFDKENGGTIGDAAVRNLDINGSLEEEVKTDSQFSYNYGADTMRLTDRHITMTGIRGPGLVYREGAVLENMVIMEAMIAYSMDATINGEPAVEYGETQFNTTLELIDGEWKIDRFMAKDHSNAS